MTQSLTVMKLESFSLLQTIVNFDSGYMGKCVAFFICVLHMFHSLDTSL